MFFHNIKLDGYKIGIHFNKSILVVDQNICATKIVSTSTVTENFSEQSYIKKWLFGATSIQKHRDKSKCLVALEYYLIDQVGSWSFGMTLLGMS